MKPFSEAKVTIIGLGFLMEYIFPCFRRAMGERAAAQLNAVTADAGDLEGKRRRLGISVLLNDNAGALRELEADGFLIRHDFKEIPPRVEYTLSDLGRSFMDVISYMKAWGDRNLPEG